MPTGPDDTLVAAKPAKKRIRPAAIVFGLLGAILVAAGVLYVIGYFMAGDNLPRNASIGGVAIGGLTKDEATARLRAELGPVAEKEIPVILGKEEPVEDEIDPVAAGLTVDYDASVANAGVGRSFDPRLIWLVLTGGAEVAPVIVVDQAKLQQAVTALAEEHNSEPADASLSYDGTEVQLEPGTVGLAVLDASAGAISQAFTEAKARVGAPIPLEVTESLPSITTGEAEQVSGEYAEPAISGPITLEAGAAGSFTISPEMLAESITFADQEGELVPVLDAKKLAEEAADEIKKVESKKPKDATVKIVDGKPKIIPAVNGTGVSDEALGKAVESVITKSGDERTADIELTGAKAKFDTKDAEKLGIKEVTGEFTTYYPHANYRNVNIGRAAELINGTLLKPGEVFSLNDIVGERTRENGFTEGSVISGGVFKEELGGGVSQSATTTYNAMFFAGLEDIEHKPHGLYISRYPPGREATVSWGSIDLKFRNNTEYGVLVQATVDKSKNYDEKGSITVKMWSTKTWEKITASKPKKSNFTWGREVDNDSPNCQPSSPVQGFDVNYSRLFYQDGKVAKKEDFFWRYNPTNKVTCTAPGR
jgi:vancomycin resistance protein YoaR